MKQRTRSIGSYNAATAGRIGYIHNNVAQPDVHLALGDVYGDRKTMVDFVSSNFRKVQAKGGVVNTPMRSERDIRPPCESLITGIQYSGTGSARKQTGAATYIGDNFLRWYGLPAPIIDKDIIDNMRTTTATSALAGVEAPAVQGQVFVAELRKTLAMLRNPMEGLRRFIEAYLKRRKNPRYKGGPAAVSTVAGCWLELRFGWRPFLLEMEAIIETLTEGNQSPRKTSRAMLEREVASTTHVVGLASTAAAGFVCDLTHQYLTKYTVRSGVLYDSKMDLNAKMGIRWADLPSTAWELVPFSFVVDWFLNVGDLISALTPRGGVRHLAEFETIKVSAYVARTCTRTVSNASWEYTPISGVQERTIETFARVPKLSSPGFAFAFSLDEALRGLRVLDALGLLIQLFRRR